MAADLKPMMKIDRIQTLTDGVLAIVLTILVLNFDVPDHQFGDTALLDFFRELARPFLAYMVSFGIVAAYWMQHTAIFHYVKVGNRSFFWLNIVFLLPLTLLPFLTQLRATYHDQNEFVTTLLYAGTNIACGVALFALWSYGRHKRLLRELAPAVDRSMRSRILLGITINAIGAAAAPISIYLSSACFLAMPLIYLSHRVVDSHWHVDAADTD